MRHVIFIGGYDPKNGKRVYAEQKKQVSVYAARFGKQITISDIDKSQESRLAWSLHNAQDQVTTQFDLLSWDDLVRQRWARTEGQFAQEAMASLREFVSTGQILQMWRLSHPLVYAATLPYGLALLAIALPLLAGGSLALLLQWLGAQSTVTWASASTITFMIAVLAYRKLRHVPVTWFLRVVAFARHYAHETEHEPSRRFYRARIRDWVKELAADLANSQADEILVVGYSAGSIIATGLLPELSRVLPPEQRSKLALLTLGNCIPVAAGLPAADALRQDLKGIALLGHFWLDITSPTDWGSIHGIDTASRYAGMPVSPFRKHLSPRLHTLFTPASYEALRKDKYRVHQQYLLCTELLGDDPQAYDYMMLLCGPLSLQQRYACTAT